MSPLIGRRASRAAPFACLDGNLINVFQRHDALTGSRRPIGPKRG
jgi:hypothetical protein